MKIWLHSFLTFALDEVIGKLPTLCFMTRESCPGPASVGGWVGPRAGLDALWKRKNNSVTHARKGADALDIWPTAHSLHQLCCPNSHILWLLSICACTRTHTTYSPISEEWD